MKEYELMLALAPVEADKRVQFLGKLTAHILLMCKDISKVEGWGEKELAYHSGNYSTGYFYLLKFTTDSTNEVRELDTMCKREDICLQHMIVRKGE